MLGTHAAAAAGVHGAHDQQLDAVDVLAELVRQVRDLGVQLVEGVAGVGGGALLGQLLHFGDGDDGVDLLLRQAQGQTQIGVRVHVGGQDGASLIGVQSGQGGGQGGLAHAALAGYCDFHA